MRDTFYCWLGLLILSAVALGTNAAALAAGLPRVHDTLMTGAVGLLSALRLIHHYRAAHPAEPSAGKDGA